ncbi:hypothetical protein Peur_013533 [Populus x canadensis]
MILFYRLHCILYLYPCFFLRTRQLFIVTLQGLSCVLTDRFHLPLYLYSVLPIFSSCINSALYWAIAGVARCTGDNYLKWQSLVVLFYRLHCILYLPMQHLPLYVRRMLRFFLRARLIL